MSNKLFIINDNQFFGQLAGSVKSGDEFANQSVEKLETRLGVIAPDPTNTSQRKAEVFSSENGFSSEVSVTL